MSLIAIGSPKAEAAESPLQSLRDFIGTKKAIIYNDQASAEAVLSNNKKQEENAQLGKKKEEKKRVPKAITNPKEIDEAAKFASEKTGVRKDFLMGMLTVESDLGRNTGKCTYGDVTRGAQEAHANGRLGATAWKTFQKRQQTIEKLATNLGYDSEQLKVSCNPGNYAGTGGALGVSQFMPDIWMAYKDEVGAIVGKENPDPWNAKDGVVAMALLLADTPGVTAHNYYAERNSAKMYLSGTISSAYDWYANQAFYWSKNYAKLLS
ncbi:MAG: lytic murein transglycosylase [Candidatus Moranbacteria bacterium]|nr:lytic murein transglycosylase [Candidatus Moranbacteria bacterium]